MDRTGEEAIKQRFGARMRELRKTRGLSQEALAFACGLDRSYLGAIERGEKNVSLINIHRIAEALEAAPAELFPT
ncbi:MAG TPA: helix-turn-helix transcriptional regulator [Allosphingosinicella sp.]|jgi:transcriptional regulator with XRE-family HTH domain